ncbi:MAG: amidohydrolase family protein [Acidobacteria bacterium]|nr:amidohydrolase family protein [Acidobacteriota bacterium]
MTYDCKIVGGTIIDGTGTDGFIGEVGISDGRIVALGNAPDSAATLIDATGSIVCPGFVDMHTHYDAQLLWDRGATCSPWHGVTTVVIGSCGFGIAPALPQHRETIMRTLEKVEGMSYDALAAGLGESWAFETYPEYLDVIEERGTAVNVAAYVGHTPVRLAVMGEDATEREASPEEIAEMRSLVADAMAAGAIGFSTSQAAAHHGAGGKPVPSRFALFDEVDALVGAVAESGHGVFQAAMGRALFTDEFDELWDRHRVPITWTALLADMVGPGSHERYLEMAAETQMAGRQIVPQVACRPIMMDFRFAEPYPFEIMPLFGEVMSRDAAGKRELYSDPDFREQFRTASAAGAKNVNAGWTDRTVISRFAPDEALEERSLAAVAAERRVDPVDLALDLGLEADLQARFRLAYLNHNETGVETLISDPHTVVTLSDAGAHADQLCDAGFATHLLGHWVRDRGALTLEAGVHELTQRPATLMGITDRGLLAEGRPADVVVFDPSTVAAAPVRRVQDLPSGAERLVSDAIGISAVIVNGELIRRDGADVIDPDGPMPGRLLRGGAAL